MENYCLVEPNSFMMVPRLYEPFWHIGPDQIRPDQAKPGSALPSPHETLFNQNYDSILLINRCKIIKKSDMDDPFSWGMI